MDGADRFARIETEKMAKRLSQSPARFNRWALKLDPLTTSFEIEESCRSVESHGSTDQTGGGRKFESHIVLTKYSRSDEFPP